MNTVASSSKSSTRKAVSFTFKSTRAKIAKRLFYSPVRDLTNPRILSTLSRSLSILMYSYERLIIISGISKDNPDRKKQMDTATVQKIYLFLNFWYSWSRKENSGFEYLLNSKFEIGILRYPIYYLWFLVIRYYFFAYT